MSDIHKSHSYPERLKDAQERNVKEEKDKLEKKVQIHVETLDKFREKDHDRAERLAELGSPSSTDVVVHIDWRARCCNSISMVIDYVLEREKEAQQEDERIQRKSYAGFYYFIKWFVRALFFLVFTTIGTIAGKEIGCEIKDHGKCQTGVVELAEGAPHLVSSIIGMVIGLIIGQWVGRFVWDHLTKNIRRCLRKLEKKADRSKAWLIATSGCVYVLVTGAFATVFFFFVDLGQDDENIIGGVAGGLIGLILAVVAYRKSSSCRSGEAETPMVYPSSSNLDPPEMVL